MKAVLWALAGPPDTLPAATFCIFSPWKHLLNGHLPSRLSDNELHILFKSRRKEQCNSL